MRVAAVLPPRKGGPYERSLRALTRRYPNAAADINRVLDALAVLSVPSPPNIVAIPGVGRTMLKVRIGSSDMKTGKSGGFRLILDHVQGDQWRAVVVYAKPKRGNVPRDDLLKAAFAEQDEDDGNE